MSAVLVPALQDGLGVDRVTVEVDLEVEVAADADCVTGLPHSTHALASVDVLPMLDHGGAGHVGVEVGALLAFAVDQ
jgi:hypothetical protein